MSPLSRKTSPKYTPKHGKKNLPPNFRKRGKISSLRFIVIWKKHVLYVNTLSMQHNVWQKTQEVKKRTYDNNIWQRTGHLACHETSPFPDSERIASLTPLNPGEFLNLPLFLRFCLPCRDGFLSKFIPLFPCFCICAWYQFYMGVAPWDTTLTMPNRMTMKYTLSSVRFQYDIS